MIIDQYMHGGDGVEEHDLPHSPHQLKTTTATTNFTRSEQMLLAAIMKVDTFMIMLHSCLIHNN
jgi:hypothetical protein